MQKKCSLLHIIEQKIINLKAYKIFFSVNDATNLPFKDNQFDATYHLEG